ncbi:DUF397 domain-containing protein, partial [Streptomyces sp. NPDC093085]|uniref:DUF397 domain-containing protein n=1 Tax=Streptomyces sp. NPDC093085 TaxID=3155068 RepID=UPI00341D1002
MRARDAEWFKSSHSGQNGDCVEARFRVNAIDCRDSKAPQGQALTFAPEAWRGFIDD